MTHVLTALLGEVRAITGFDNLDCNTLYDECQRVLGVVRRETDHDALWYGDCSC